MTVSRMSHIVYRAHPVALAVYVVVLLLGVFSITGVFNFDSISQVIGPAWHYMWAWLLTVGSALSLLGVFLNRDLEDGLSLEALGCGASALGFAAYVACYLEVYSIHFDVRVSNWVFYMILGIGCLVRSFQCLRDRKIVRRLQEEMNHDGR